MADDHGVENRSEESVRQRRRTGVGEYDESAISVVLAKNFEKLLEILYRWTFSHLLLFVKKFHDWKSLG